MLKGTESSSTWTAQERLFPTAAGGGTAGLEPVCAFPTLLFLIIHRFQSHNGLLSFEFLVNLHTRPLEPSNPTK